MIEIMRFNIHNIADRYEIDICHKDINDLADRLFGHYDRLYFTDIRRREYDTFTKLEFLNFMFDMDEFRMVFEDHALIIDSGEDVYMIEGCIGGKPVDISDYEIFE